MNAAHLLLLIFRCLALLASGLAIHTLWKICQLPYHDSWGYFHSLWFPLLYGMFSIAYMVADLCLQWKREGNASPSAHVTSRFHRYDDNTYLLLLWVFILEIVALYVESVLIWLTVTYLALIFVKGGLFTAYLYHVLRRETTAHVPPDVERNLPARIPLRIQGLLVLTALLVYVPISAYHLQRTSLTGDEPHYLLITHSLWHDHDTNLYNNYEHRDYASFFWYELEPAWGDQVSKNEIYSYRHKGGFPYFLILGYVLGGQFGTVLQINLVTALLLLQLFLLSYELFHSPTASFWAWVCSGLTMPIIVYMGQIYPETVAALLVLLAVRQIWKLPANQIGHGKAFWFHCLSIIMILTFLIALKTRYVPIAGTIIFAWFFFLIRGRLRAKYLRWTLPGFIIVLGLGGAFTILLDRYVFGGSFWGRFQDMRFMSYFFAGHNPLFAALGLLWDQEYGLFTYAPLYIAALVGVGILTRKELRVTWPILGIIVANYVVIAVWPLWHAAPTPPSRYLLPILPLLGVFFARFFLHPGGVTQNILLGVTALWSGFMTWFVTFLPSARYNWADGTNNFFETASLHISLDLTDLFPSLIRLSPLTPYTTLVGCGAIGGLLYVCRRSDKKATELSQNQHVEFQIAVIIAVTFALVFGGIALGKKLPTQVLEAEDALDVRTHGGEREPGALDPWQNQNFLRKWAYYGWKLSPDTALEARPRISPGTITLTVYARAQLKEEAKVPRMLVLLNGKEIGNVPITSKSWQPYEFQGQTDEQRPLIEIRCAPDVNEQHAIIIDKIRVR